MKRRIALISTGGTIEKTYDELSGVLANHVSVLDVMLASLELRGVEVQRVRADEQGQPRDDARGSHADRGDRGADGARVATASSSSTAPIGSRTPASAIVELAGTPASPIVFTGAMRPYELRSTDALQNLTEALLAVQLLAPGVYVAMHNQVLQFPGVIKDRSAGHVREGADVTCRSSARSLPALLDALDDADVGVMVIAIAQRRLEKLLRERRRPRASLGYTPEEMDQRPADRPTIAPERTRALCRRARSRARAPASRAARRRSRCHVIHKDGHAIAHRARDGPRRVPDERLASCSSCATIGIAPAPQLSLLEADRIALVGALAAGFAHETNNPLTSVLLNLRSLRKQLARTSPTPRSRPRCAASTTSRPAPSASRATCARSRRSRRAARRRPIDLAARRVGRAPPRRADARAARARGPPDLPGRPGHRRRVAHRPGRARDDAVLELGLRRRGRRDEQPDRRRRRGARPATSSSRSPTTAATSPPRRPQHAFDPFFRSPVRGAGVGVGLGVARSVASTLGGEVALAPRPGGGAVITMRLPLAASPPA